MVAFVRRHPPLHRSAKLVHRSLASCKRAAFHRRPWVFDPPSIRGKWYREIKRTQIDARNPLYIDRQGEIKEFFGVSGFYLLAYYARHGLPSSDRFKRHYLRGFYGNTAPGKLKAAYDMTVFDYTLRLMLAYERYSLITDYLGFLIEDSGRSLSEFRMLDYGCGVSDIGLLLSSLGARVTICDLDNNRLDFTVWRFRRRGFDPQTIRVTDTEIYPRLLQSEFDLIIATELFEHVRDPLKLLQNLTLALKTGGYLFDSMGGRFERDDRPHHLREASRIGNSAEYRAFYSSHYVHLSPARGLTYLFRKR